LPAALVCPGFDDGFAHLEGVADAMKYVLKLSASFALLVIHASAHACPADASLDRLLSHRALVIGDVHGTVETPRFFRCLIERALATSDEPLTVSLELEPQRFDLNSKLWDGRDGRTSEAMWQLTRFLLDQKEQGKLSLHSQFQKPVSDAIHGDGAQQGGQSGRSEEFRGLAIKELAQRGRVIALMGNAHANRDPMKFEGMPEEFVMAGHYMGPDVTRVRIETIEDGRAWICTSMQACADQAIKSLKIPGAKAGDLVDGNAFGYEFIYFLEERRYTASPPHIPGTQQTPARGE
jgi:hypothetical protein